MEGGLSRRLPTVAAAAGCLMAAGSVLDWSGVEYSSQLDRWLSFAAGTLALAVAVAARYQPRWLAVTLVAGALGLNMAVVNIRDISGHEYEYARYPEAAVGLGLYAVLVGALLTLATGLVSLAFFRRRR
jgi:peptidoglycan/LPS O-acetylase OafA/YrhL